MLARAEVEPAAFKEKDRVAPLIAGYFPVVVRVVVPFSRECLPLQLLPLIAAFMIKLSDALPPDAVRVNLPLGLVFAALTASE